VLTDAQILRAGGPDLIPPLQPWSIVGEAATRMADIFLSCADADRDAAADLVAEFTAGGWSVFWDQRLGIAGLDEVLRGEIASAKYVVVLWSKHSVISQRVIDEADTARIRNVLLPVLLDDARPPIGFRAIHAADLSGWRRAVRHPELGRFIEDVAGAIGTVDREAFEARNSSERRAGREGSPVHRARRALAGAGPATSAPIFISYVEEDRSVVDQLVRGIEGMGYQTWYYERDATPGPSYLEQVGEAIDGCSAIVLVISPVSVASPQVTVEVVRAHEAGKRFLPLRIGISHQEFQRRNSTWRMALGASATIDVPSDVSTIMQRIEKGLAFLFRAKP
jgi:hypothetical protein